MVDNNFQPDWASPPGDTIVDILEEKNILISVFTQQMGHSLEYTIELLQGHVIISMDIARQLDKILGPSVEFWINRETQYREDLARLQK